MVNHAVALPVVENDLYSGFTAFVREYANEGTDSALTNTIISKTAEIILFFHLKLLSRFMAFSCFRDNLESLFFLPMQHLVNSTYHGSSFL